MSDLPHIAGEELRLLTTNARGDLVDLRYRVLLPIDAKAASATPMVFIMGFNCSMYAWLVNQLPHTVAQHRPVLLLDNRGLRTLPDCGQRWSAHTTYALTKAQLVHFGLELQDDLGLEDLADDVKLLMDHALPQQRLFHVVGVSMGGMVAQHVALRYPEKLASLVLLSTTADSQANAARLAAKTPAMAARGNPLPIPSAIHPPSSDEEKRLAATLNLVMSIALQPEHSSMLVGSRWRGRNDPMAPLRFLAEKFPHSPHAVAIHQRASRKHNVVDLLTAEHPLLIKRVPVLVMTGEEDPLRDLECAHQLIRLIPNARLVTYEGTGHMLWMEREEELTQELVSWTAQHEP